MTTVRDYIVVGTGLTGCTIARLLADAGKDLLVLDRRTHIGGNVHDTMHPSGIRLHTYGPHYFRTNSESIWAFVNRFARFHSYEAVVKSLIDDRYENWPIAQSYIRRNASDWKYTSHIDVRNFEEACLSHMPRIVYDKFIRGYTEKQWGVDCRYLDKSLFSRFDVREDDEPRLSRDRYQGIPQDGYHSFISKLLCGITVHLNCDWLSQRESFIAKKLLIFTGPIDEFFGFEYGHLAYRSQRREHSFVEDVAFFQPCGQVNNPSPTNGSHIRTIEWKHMMPHDQIKMIRGTLLTREFPFTPADADQFEYPFPDACNATLYRKYAQRAATLSQTLICGRLGEYRYYDMDQAIARAMMLARRILEQ